MKVTLVGGEAAGSIVNFEEKQEWFWLTKVGDYPLIRKFWYKRAIGETVAYFSHEERELSYESEAD